MTSRILAAAVAVTLAIGALVVGAAAALASTVNKTVSYQCDFPVLGSWEVPVAYTLDIPDSAAAGARIVNGDLSMVALLDKQLVSALTLVQVAAVNGTATVDITAGHGGAVATFGMPGFVIPQQTLPMNEMLLQIYGSVPSMVVYHQGGVPITTGQEIVLRLETRQANGELSPLGVIDVPCMALAMQDRTLKVVSVAGNLANQPGLGNQFPGGSLSKPLTYSCVFPQIGATDVATTWTGSVPASGAHGTRVQPTLTVTATVPPAFATVLRNNNAAKVSGTGRVDVFSTYDWDGMTLGVPSKVPSVPVPPAGTAMTMTFPLAMPSFSIPVAGSIASAAGPGFSGTLTPLKANDTGTALGAFTVPCTLKPGQNPALGTITIT
ncbi:DUF6801 domain-containing protein [Actinocrispum wychmicini]|uniref:DUF6801 domain-containing protein n=1 Tax=Actinocrispum wychmicini TaxID=1213861 RepID=A0A4R2IQ83_9PSEU|nr:DUF6801 domain-containing protein [Actinocrispum wychmicini]TCO46506.1 hypothetical protein EV192_11985 [Actinocrispum wychmicini]